MSALGRLAMTVFIACLALGWLGVREWWLAVLMAVAFLTLCWALRERRGSPWVGPIGPDHPDGEGSLDYQQRHGTRQR